MSRLDARARAILYELDGDSRASAAQIGRRIRLSKDTVAYRISGLVQDRVIEKFLTVLDTARLGFTTYKVLFRFQKVSERDEQEIIRYWSSHPRVQWLASLDGAFDLGVNILAVSPLEFAGFLREFRNRFGDHVAEQQILIMLETNFFPREYLAGGTPAPRKPVFFGSQEERAHIDKKDEAILTVLCEDARLPLVDIARRTALSALVVASRIRRMKQERIIQAYSILPRLDALGMVGYKILFRLRNVTELSEKALFSFAQKQPNVWFHSRALGGWDLELNVDAAGVPEFRRIIRQIKAAFSDTIQEYIVLGIAQTHTFNFYPLGRALPEKTLRRPD